MDQFEIQCREMEGKIEEHTKEINCLKEEQDILQKEINEQRELIECEKKKLERYQRKNEYYKRIEKDNEILVEENTLLTKKNRRLDEEKRDNLLGMQKENKEKTELLKQIQALEKELEEERKRQTWFSRLWMKKK